MAYITSFNYKTTSILIVLDSGLNVILWWSKVLLKIDNKAMVDLFLTKDRFDFPLLETPDLLTVGGTLIYM